MLLLHPISFFNRAEQLANYSPRFGASPVRTDFRIAPKVMMNVKQPHLHIRRLKWSCNTTISELHAKELLTIKDTTKYVGLDVPKEKISVAIALTQLLGAHPARKK
ncbi:hypothetical protein [Cohnella laeviribosi]|uniref:hypothetical protein n=1 Tax=Cohnella laeviribosi TaxID=380174 RepID=UPI0012EB5137|nr:hypothetical protein [Cohnella laeviribosi]